MDMLIQNISEYAEGGITDRFLLVPSDIKKTDEITR